MATLKVGDRREAVVIEQLSRTHIVKYAGASGDFHPIHHDDAVAREVGGYPGVFAHGMFTMGLTGRLLTDWVGPTALRSFSMRFTSQVWPGDTLTATAEVVAVGTCDGERLATLVVKTLNQDGAVVGDGEATAAF